jgi:hypothetical protein
VLGDKLCDPLWDAKKTELQDIEDRCAKFGVTDLIDATLQEEQERELMVELEEERLTTPVERVKPYEPAVHPAVRAFVQTGRIDSISSGFRPAFETLSSTSVAAFFDPKQWAFPNELLVTEDFARTVSPMHEGVDFVADHYQRPVQWVVTSYRQQARHSILEHMVIFSPWEVGQLLADFTTFSAVNLHLYAPRTSPSHEPLDDLRLYAVPRLPSSWEIPARRTLQLNLFAGSLYLRDYDNYEFLCRFLGLSYRVNEGGNNGRGPGARSTRWQRQQGPFTNNPLAFLKAMIMTIRRDGRDISGTHIGDILAQKILQEKDFNGQGTVEEEDDDDDDDEEECEPL